MWILRGFLLLVCFLLVAFFLGPKTEYPSYSSKVDSLSLSFEELEEHIETDRQKHPKMLPENQASLHWFDGKQKTEYSIVYLHGFSASPKEGEPVHKELAQRYGCNLYLARLVEHGIQDSSVFENLSPKDLIESAKEAIAIGHLIGEKVIVMSCSTGSTLATYLAAENPNLIHSMIMYSPNFALYDSSSKIALAPWGKQIARAVVGEYRTPAFSEEAKKYWTDKYKVEGAIAVTHLLHETMTDEVFKKIDLPYFIGYWYKNEEVFDKVISIDRIKEFDALTSTPQDKKQVIPFASVGAHVICSPIMSKDVDTVRQATFAFIDKLIGNPLN